MVPKSLFHLEGNVRVGDILEPERRMRMDITPGSAHQAQGLAHAGAQLEKVEG